MKFHEKLYAVRKKAGMTQNDLAEKMNVSRQAVSRWEMGTAMPDVENLVAMSDLFGVSLDYLLKDHAASAQQAEMLDIQHEKAEKEKSDQKGSWLLIPIAMPLIGLSFLINGWLFEKDILWNIGFFLLGLSLVVLGIGFVAELIYSGIKRIRKEKSDPQ